MTLPPDPRAPAPQPQMRQIKVRLHLARPIVTYVIMGLTILVYLLQEGTSLLLNQDLPLLYGAKYTPWIIQGQLWRLLTPVFLHGSLEHIVFNMIALYMFAPRIEAFYGHKRFLAIYTLSALGGNILSFWFTNGVSVGASTAISGLLAANVVFIYRNKPIFGPKPQEVLIRSVVYLLISLALGFTGQNIDNWGHLGGLFVGLAFAWFAGPRLQPDDQRPEPNLVDQQTPAVIWEVTGIISIVLAILTYVRTRMG